MSKNKIFAILIILALIGVTAAAVYTRPELHKTFEIQILKFIKADN